MSRDVWRYFFPKSCGGRPEMYAIGLETGWLTVGMRNWTDWMAEGGTLRSMGERVCHFSKTKECRNVCRSVYGGVLWRA